MRFIFLWLFSILIFCGDFAKANEDLQLQFDAAMEEYRVMSDAFRRKRAAMAITRAYEISNQLHVNDEPRRAALTLKVGIARTDARMDQAEPFLNAARAYYERTPGSEQRLVEVYLALARHQRKVDYKKKRRVYDFISKALDAGKSDPMAYAMASYGAGHLINDMELFKKPAAGLKHLTKAYSALSKMNAQNTTLFANTAFTLGVIERRKRKFARAEAYMLESLQSLRSIGEESSMDLALTHKELVKVYELRGMSERATPHAIEAGRMLSGRFGKGPSLMFKGKFRASSASRREFKGTEHELLIDIDENGFVQNPRLVTVVSDEKSKIKMLDVIKKYRYAPAFENGKPIYTKDFPVKLLFWLW